MHTRRMVFAVVFLVLAFRGEGQTPAPNEKLQGLARDYWSWRAQMAPFNGDDVNRMERPGGTRDWSRAAIERRLADLGGFEKRWKALEDNNAPIAEQVDYRLIGSALARVHWELEINPRWKRDPNFYLEQTLTALAEALTVPGPYDAASSHEILTRLRNIPSIVASGSEILMEPPKPFATVAIAALEKIRPRLATMATALQPATTLSAGELTEAASAAADALEKFQHDLQNRLPTLPERTALGRDAYLFFLRNVALDPYTPEEILAMGRQEWDRAVAFEAFEAQRNRNVPQLALATDIESWQRDEATKEKQIRAFLETHGILTVPDWLQHYTFRPTPAYLQPLDGFTELDDFTSPSRLHEDCIRYVNPPSRDAGYFMRTTATDPRPLTVHEGIPGHYFQLCLSWKNPDPIRRHYYDSGANEGIGFYAEEMMLQAGLFDDSPHSREIIYNFMRLRALRVEVDVKLALGDFTLEQAAKYLEQKVPMDSGTAHAEATAFSTGPGQALTYQIGKLQITKLLAEARLAQGDRFDLRALHDFVWRNGNVPLALQRWEYLGQRESAAK